MSSYTYLKMSEEYLELYNTALSKVKDVESAKTFNSGKWEKKKRPGTPLQNTRKKRKPSTKPIESEQIDLVKV